MHDFFAELKGWPAGEEHLHWLLLPDPDQAHELLYQRYHDLTHLDDGLAPVQPRWMHLTIQHIGPLRDITEAEVGQLTDLARQHCAHIPPLDLTIGAAQAWDHGLVCPAWPAQPARKLWDLMIQVSQHVTGDRFPVRPPVFYPHLTLAYAVSGVDARPIRAWLSDHPADPITLTISHLTLVAEQHNQRDITWRPIDEIPLAGPAAG